MTAARILLLLLSVLTAACGPLHAPMPVRLDAEHQVKVDASWDSAFNPVDRLDEQELLDVLMTSHAYQAGVDRLSFRSEKHCAAGLVIMEIYYDRERPDDDAFIVTLQNDASQIVRRHVYTREDVGRTYRELFIETESLRRRGELRSNEESERLDELERRVALCKEILPDFDVQPNDKDRDR